MPCLNCTENWLELAQAGQVRLDEVGKICVAWLRARSDFDLTLLCALKETLSFQGTSQLGDFGVRLEDRAIGQF